MRLQLVLRPGEQPAGLFIGIDDSHQAASNAPLNLRAQDCSTHAFRLQHQAQPLISRYSLHSNYPCSPLRPPHRFHLRAGPCRQNCSRSSN